MCDISTDVPLLTGRTEIYLYVEKLVIAIFNAGAYVLPAEHEDGLGDYERARLAFRRMSRPLSSEAKESENVG